MRSVARRGMARLGAARHSKVLFIKKGSKIMAFIHATIEGISPLLMNRFDEETEVKISSGTSSVMRGSKGTPREQATRKAYADQKGNLYIPGPNIFSCLVQAGKFHKAGKSKITTQKSSLIPAGVSIVELICPLNTKNFEVDSRSVVIPATGGRIMCHRPRLDVWRLSFTLDVDLSMFSVALIRQVLEDAGKKVGLGDFRPDRKGTFGRFAIVEWQEEVEKKAA
jgi:hypothetical protein